MNARKKLAVTLALVLAFAFVLPVSAQGGTLLLPCAGEDVSGTVVAVDEEGGVITVDTGDGLCSVTLNGEYDHPIVTLLGSYFDAVSAENLVAALQETQGCAVYDEESDAWTWADCDDPDAVPVTVTGENEDGTFEFSASVDGEEVSGSLTVEDADTAANLADALAVLLVQWNLGEDGALIQAGDEIAAYHEDGIGFGVLVKIYAMAAELHAACEGEEEPCGATVEELVAAFQSGMGIGELYQEYGKPELVGVGHVRQELSGRPGRASRLQTAGQTRFERLAREGAPVEAVGDGSGSGAGGRPENSGRPENAGPKPKDPKDNGKPADAGKPDKTGKPKDAGPKDNGKPEGAGRPENPGNSGNGGPKPKKDKGK
jgi:hypothetical protein